MIVLCASGHRTLRGNRDDHAADPRCHELTPTGFCLAPSWQEPNSVRKGDVVAVVDDRRIIRCVVETWGGNPDRHAVLIDEFGMTRRVYAGAWWTAGQPHPAGRPLLTPADAQALLPALVRIATESRVQPARGTRGMPLPGPRGRLEVYDLPLVLYDASKDAHESGALSIYLQEHPRFDAAMAWMQRHQPAFYQLLVLNIHEARGPADLQQLLGISSYSNAKVRLHRARRTLRAVMDTAVSSSAGVA